jgi:SAM-dependent methyltransferase
VSTDRRTLTEVAYADSGPLRARAALYDFEREPMHLPTWLFTYVPVPAGARVLEVGCGPAPYLSHLVASGASVLPVGCDLSLGMAQEAQPAGSVAVGDAQALPFAAGSFDVVLAPHMLYHVPDIASAARELARVARGVVAIVTNARGHTDELFQLLAASARDVAGPSFSLRARTFDRFLFEDAPARLGDALVIESSVAAVGVIDVPFVDPVVDYLDSMRALYLDDFSTTSWAAVLDAARARVGAAISEHGVWTTHKHIGLLIGRPA